MANPECQECKLYKLEAMSQGPVLLWKNPSRPQKEDYNKFVQTVNALMNEDGGGVLIHTNTPYLLDNFDQQVDAKLRELIPDNSPFLSWFDRQFIDRQHVFFRVKTKNGDRPLSVYSFNLKIPLNKGLCTPSNGEVTHRISEVLLTNSEDLKQEYPRESPVFKHKHEVVYQRDSGEIPFQECAWLQAKYFKCFSEPDSNEGATAVNTPTVLEQIVSKILEHDPSIKDYISAFSGIYQSGGGSIYFGIREKKGIPIATGINHSSETTGNSARQSTVGTNAEIPQKEDTRFVCEGIYLSDHGKQELTQTLAKKLKHSLLWCGRSNLCNPIVFHFHKVEQNIYVLEVQVQYYHGLCFRNGHGPLAYKLLRNVPDTMVLENEETENKKEAKKLKDEKKRGIGRFAFKDWADRCKVENILLTEQKWDGIIDDQDPCGNNVMQGASGNNPTPGSTGNNTTPSATGNNTASGTTGNNTTPGTTGNNTTPGTTGNNTTPGTTENNTTPGTTGNNTTPGTTGNNTTPGTTEKKTTTGTTGNNTTPGTTGNNTTPGTTGNNTTPGTTGNNTTPGTTGNNTTPGTTGNNAGPGTTGNNPTPGTTGNNTMPGTTGNNTTPGTTGNNTTPGTTGNNTTPGTTGNNPTPGTTGNNPTPGTPGNNPTPGTPGNNPTPGTTGNNPTPGTTGNNPTPGTTGNNPTPGTTGNNPTPSATGNKSSTETLEYAEMTQAMQTNETISHTAPLQETACVRSPRERDKEHGHPKKKTRRSRLCCL